MYKFKFKYYAVTMTVLLILIAATTLINSGHTDAQNPTPPTQVRNIDNPALQPFQAFSCGTFGSETIKGKPLSTWQTDIAQVPDGKRFVIEYITAKANLMPDENLKVPKNPELELISVTTTVSNVRGAHFLAPLDQEAEFIPDRVVLSQQIKGLYADPGTKVSFFARSDAIVDQASSVCFSISGYLVDLGQLTPVDVTPSP